MTLEEALEAIKRQEESIKKLELKNAEIISEKRQEQSKREEAEAEKLKADEKIAQEQGNFEKLLEIEKQKNEELVKGLTEKSSAQFKQLEKQLLTAKVSELSKTLGGDNAELLTPHIAKRMELQDREGELTLVVLDEKGQATDQTTEDLENEFRNSDKFASVVVGTGSSGGGANNSGGGSGSGSADGWEKYFVRDAQGNRADFDKVFELKGINEALYNELLKKHP